MRAGLTISTVAHGAFILWSVLVLVAKPFDNKVTEAAPVDIISADEFSKMTKGQKNAKKPDPKPLVEKIADTPKPIEEVTHKVADKKEILPTSAEPPPPQAETPKPEKKAEKPAEADTPKPEKKAEKPPEPKPDPIAEALKKDEAKKPEKKAEAKPPQPKPTPQAKPAPKFDPMRIAALIDKRDPQRQATTGAVLNNAPALGTQNGQSQTLSQSELDALRARLSQCWNPPVGALDAQRLIVVLRIVFNPDGTVARPPEMVEATPSPVGPAMVESAKRAVLQCQPYTMLRPETYNTWKDMELLFDPRDMFRG
jgi:colicin import membrane protein